MRLIRTALSPKAQTVPGTRSLIGRGHLERAVISHDIRYRTSLTRRGYGHIFANVVPMMQNRGFTAAETEAITIGNPRRLLTFI